MALIALNPATGETIAEYPETTPAEVQDAIEAAHELTWNGNEHPFPTGPNSWRRRRTSSGPGPGVRGTHDHGDGKTGQRRSGGGREVCLGLRLLCRER